MPINVETALGSELPSQQFAWDEDQVILYHLGLGAGAQATDPLELSYTYEGNLSVLPSFGTVAAYTSMASISMARGVDINWALLLHGEQDLQIRTPIPRTGEVTSQPRIAAIYDKGRAALMVVEVTSTDNRTGEVLFVNRASLFVRGEGGWGGDSGPKASNQAPDREPDHVSRSPTLPQQALLYRLSGDKNPLHADPAFAAWVVSTVPSCTACAPTVWSARRPSTPCWGGPRAGPALPGPIRRGGVSRRDGGNPNVGRGRRGPLGGGGGGAECNRAVQRSPLGQLERKGSRT